MKRAGFPAFFLLAISRWITGSAHRVFYPLEQLLHLHDGYRRVFRLPGAALLLLQEDGQRFLIKNVCPHKDFPLHESRISEGCLRCPYHGLTFDLMRQGRCVSSPTLQLTFYPIVYDGKFLGVDWPN